MLIIKTSFYSYLNNTLDLIYFNKRINAIIAL